jgi:hypothetical protein
MSEKDIKMTAARVIDCYRKLLDYINNPEIPKPKNPLDSELIQRVKL